MSTLMTAGPSDLVTLTDAELDAVNGGIDQASWGWSPSPDQMNPVQYAYAYWRTSGWGTFQDFAYQLMN